MGQKISRTEQYTILQTIGLTSSEAQLYICMLQHPTLHRVPHINEQLGMSTSTLYRSLQSLCAKGFLSETRIIRSPLYHAIPLTHALDNFASYQRQVAKPLIAWQRENDS